MNIGRKLKEHRIHHNFTQDEVAKKLFVSRATISSWEVGRTFPDIEKIILLSELYELSLDQLLKEEPSIMETIQVERKKLKHYRYVKWGVTFLIFSILLYSVYFIILGMSYPEKNTEFSLLKGTSRSFYYEDAQEYLLNIKYPVFWDATGNLAVSTSDSVYTILIFPNVFHPPRVVFQNGKTLTLSFIDTVNNQNNSTIPIANGKFKLNQTTYSDEEKAQLLALEKEAKHIWGETIFN